MTPSDKVWLKSNNPFCKTYVFMFLLFKRSLFSFKQVSVWTVLLCSIKGIFCLLHTFLGRLFTHFVFLFWLSPLCTIKENFLIFSLVFSGVKRSLTELTILLKVSSKFKSFVPTWSIKCFGLKSWIDGFAWSYVQLILSELNNWFLTRFLWWSFLIIKYLFSFSTMMLPWIKNAFGLLVIFSILVYTNAGIIIIIPCVCYSYYYE